MSDDIVEGFRSQAQTLAARLSRAAARKKSPATSEEVGDEDIAEAEDPSTTTEKRKIRSREAQARYREKQRAKHAGNEQAVQKLQKAIQKLEQEKAALVASQASFAKDKAAWQAQLQASEQLPSQWLSPATRAQGLSPADTYEDVEHKMPGMVREQVDREHALLCITHEALKWPQPSRRAVEQSALDEVYERMQVYVAAMQALVDAVDARPSPGALGRVTDYMSELVLFHLHMWQSYVQGNPMWRICDTAWGDKIAHNHGAPPEGLWKLVADRLALSADQQTQLLSLRQRWQHQMQGSQQRAARVSSIAQGFMFVQPAGFLLPVEQAICAEEAEMQLQLCFREQREAARNFFIGALQQVFTPYQHATLHLASHPYKADLLAICEEISPLHDPVGFAAELPSPPASIFTEFTGSAGLQAGSSLPVAVQPLPLGELGSVLGPSHSSGLSSQGWQQHGRSFPPGRSRLGPPEGAQGPGAEPWSTGPPAATRWLPPDVLDTDDPMMPLDF